MEDAVLQFRNDVEALILSATGGDPDKVTRLAHKAGITDPPDNHDVGVCVTIIVFEKARSGKKVLDLLKYLPDVCGELEGDKPKKLNKLLDDLNRLFPEVRQATGASAEPMDSAADASELYNAGIDVVRRTKDLKLKFRTLLSSQELTRIDVEEISDKLSASASDIEALLRAHPAGERPSIPARRLLMSLGRIEGEIFKCFDSLWYYNVVHSILEESRSAAANISIAEADRAAAEMLRLRELNQARSQIRHRLDRIIEECEFFVLR
jgi:hypothetical protein